jgi:O-antigen/teichoic acid export membrane protein
VNETRRLRRRPNLLSNSPPPPHQPRLASNASWRFAATLVRVAVGLVSVALFTRILGMSQWGLLALFQAAVAPLALLDGLGRATVKYVAESLGRGDRQEAARVVRTAAVLNLGLGLVGVAALVLSAPWLAVSLFAIPVEDVPRAIAGFRLMAAPWFITVVTTPYSAVFVAHQRYDAVAKLATVSVVLSVGLGLAAAALTRDVVAVLLAQTGVAGAMLVVYVWGAGRLLPGSVALPRIDPVALRRSLAFWRWEVVGVAGGIATGWADRYMLGAFLGPTAVGIYAVANTLATQLYTAFVELGEVLFPAVSHMEGRGDLPGARRLTLLVGWTLATVFGACAVVLAVIGGDFLHLWVSAQAAREGTPVLRVLCVAFILAITAIAPLFYVLGIGRTRWDAAAGVLVGATVVAMGLALVPRYGLLGVGFGLLAGVTVRCGLVLLMWREHFRSQFSLRQFTVHVWAPALTSICMLLALANVHDRLAHAPSWPWLIVEGVVTLCIAAGVQVGVSELMPGGPQRRRDVVASFRPIAARWLGSASVG